MEKYDSERKLTEEQRRTFMNRINDDYEIYRRQREERSNLRYEKEKIRNKRKKFIAFITAGMLALGTVGVSINYQSKKTDEYMKQYKAYMDYVNEQQALGFNVEISEEGYNEFVSKTFGEKVMESIAGYIPTYDEYVEYVYEQQALGFDVAISEEGYKQFVKNYLAQIEEKKSRGAY